MDKKTKEFKEKNKKYIEARKHTDSFTTVTRSGRKTPVFVGKPKKK